MSTMEYTVQGLAVSSTRLPRSTLAVAGEESLDSANHSVSWIPSIWGGTAQSATMLIRGGDSEREAWVAAGRRATLKWLGENA